MNRINQTIKKNQKKTKSDQKEIPTFGVDGNVIIPGKKERQKIHGGARGALHGAVRVS